MLRLIRLGAFGLIAVLACIWAGVWWHGHAAPSLQAAVGVAPGVSVGGPFSLVDAQGAAVTDATYRGRWMLVYFGYTTCPDVCPTELQAMSATLDQLGPLAAQVAPIFITIDPERDTPAALADYVKQFDDRLVGLTGTPAQVAAVARVYRVYFSKVEAKGGAPYMMDHSSFLYLMGPDGSLRQLIQPNTPAPEIAAVIRQKMLAS